jgi:hypothetical protein
MSRSSRAGIHGRGQFCFEGPDNGGSASFLNDFVKLGTVISHEANAFNQDIVDAPTGWKFDQTIDHREWLAARGSGDAGGNFTAVRRQFHGCAIGNFGSLRTDDASGVSPNHQFAEEVRNAFLVRGGKLTPTGAHGLAGNEVKGEAFFQQRSHPGGQVFVSVAGVGGRENIVDRTVEHSQRIVDGCGAGKAHGSKDSKRQRRFQEEWKEVESHNYLGADGEGAGEEETLPKAKRLMIDSRSMADSVSVIRLPGERLLLSAPGASATYLSPMRPLVLIEAIVSEGRWTACFTCR